MKVRDLLGQFRSLLADKMDLRITRLLWKAACQLITWLDSRKGWLKKFPIREYLALRHLLE